LLDVPGRQYPIEFAYQPPLPVRDSHGRVNTPPVWDLAAKVAGQEAQKSDCGNILIFMPGAYEIRRTLQALERVPALKSWELVALYGSLSPEMQNRAVEPSATPRVIVSTNIAETSLTIDGVRTVIDSGQVRRAQWDPARSMDTLYICKISQASAAQRAGRAGRTAPGRCVRLWSQADHQRRATFDAPEVLGVDLSSSLLILKKWGILDPMQFRWLTPPVVASVERATALLTTLGAIDGEGALTPTGMDMLNYPLAPRLSRLMVAGIHEQCVPEMAAIAALLESEYVGQGGSLREDFREPDDYTDFQAEWRAVTEASRCQFNTAYCSDVGLLARACREVTSAYHQLISIGSRGTRVQDVPDPEWTSCQESVVCALVETFIDNVGVRHSIAANTCKLVGKRSGKIAASSVALKSPLLVATDVAEVGGNGVETRVSRCTQIDEEILQKVAPQEFEHTSEARFDDQYRRVVSVTLTQFKDLVIEERRQLEARPEQACQVLAEKVVDGTLKLNCWDDAIEQWIRRLNALSAWMPELELPKFEANDRVLAISMICEGAVSYKEIKDRDVLPVLKEWLAPWQQEALDRYAPTRMKLTNGESPKVHYDEDGTPTIALQVQRLFGVTQTPTVADGRQKVRVNILAPNRRPWQITMSLEGFWETGYPQMKKELAGRYPKHAWPNEAPKG
jgi:ATP-dependent helicase HrpB